MADAEIPSIATFVPVLSALIGGLVGGGVTVAGQLVVLRYKERPQRQLEDKQREMLHTMLQTKNMPKGKGSGEKVSWRSFEVLRDVVGADDDTARRLLIEIGARRMIGSKDMWALEKNKPLSKASKVESKEEGDD